MKRTEAIRAISDRFQDDFIVACNGYISRELFNLHHSDHNFYVLGSMGLPSSIGLGLTIARPDKKIIVVTGDGNQLMSLGTMVTIGKLSPRNFIEIVLDNECYETTGGQGTSSSAARFDKLALSSSFRRTIYALSLREFLEALAECTRCEGPILVHAKIEKGDATPPRAKIDPVKTKTEFMRALGSKQTNETNADD